MALVAARHRGGEAFGIRAGVAAYVQALRREAALLVKERHRARGGGGGSPVRVVEDQPEADPVAVGEERPAGRKAAAQEVDRFVRAEDNEGVGAVEPRVRECLGKLDLIGKFRR